MNLSSIRSWPNKQSNMRRFYAIDSLASSFKVFGNDTHFLHLFLLFLQTLFAISSQWSTLNNNNKQNEKSNIFLILHLYFSSTSSSSSWCFFVILFYFILFFFYANMNERRNCNFMNEKKSRVLFLVVERIKVKICAIQKLKYLHTCTRAPVAVTGMMIICNYL